MSLDTVLKIGKALRQAENSLKYFKYVERPEEKGIYPLCITIPVDKNYRLDWNKVNVTPENEEEKLYYLKFKTSDSDGLVKYIYGDIYYGKTSVIKNNGSIEQGEVGYYRLSNPNHSNAAYRASSYNRGNADFENIISDNKDVGELPKLRNIVNANLILIERLLEYPSAIVYYFSNDTKYSFEDFINDEKVLIDYTIKQNINQLSKSDLKKLKIDANSPTEQMKSTLLKLTNCKIFIHFEFADGEKKHWYQYKKELSLITDRILSEFVDKTDKGYVLKKTLYKTLCSGDQKNDIQFPNFSTSNKYLSKTFDEENIQDLFYALSFASKGKIITGTDIKLIVLPRGENLKAEDFEKFQNKNNENQITVANSTFEESLFDFSNDNNKDITSFDLIFCKKGGLSSPDKDLIEISGIEKSKLRMTRERISSIAKQVYEEEKVFIGTNKDLIPLSIENSFRTLLGNPQYEQKSKKVKFESNPKFKSNLLKVLPQIYNDSYCYDNMLLSAFIQNVEFSIRSDDIKFSFLKFNLMFLLKIQNNLNDKYMEIIKSKSYHIGLLLGTLAKNIEINSFEKNYVGTLTRRITTISDFIKLKTDIEQKLIMHDKTKYTYQISYELSQEIKEFDCSYNKDECAFGFMESYFKPLPPK